MATARPKRARPEQKFNNLGEQGRYTGVHVPGTEEARIDPATGFQDLEAFYQSPASRAASANSSQQERSGVQGVNGLGNGVAAEAGGKKTRPDRFHELGERGRKTGIQISQVARDANGFEDLEAFYAQAASPEANNNNGRSRKGQTPSFASLDAIATNAHPDTMEEGVLAAFEELGTETMVGSDDIVAQSLARGTKKRNPTATLASVARGRTDSPAVDFDTVPSPPPSTASKRRGSVGGSRRVIGASPQKSKSKTKGLAMLKGKSDRGKTKGSFDFSLGDGDEDEAEGTDDVLEGEVEGDAKDDVEEEGPEENEEQEEDDPTPKRRRKSSGATSKATPQSTTNKRSSRKRATEAEDEQDGSQPSTSRPKLTPSAWSALNPKKGARQSMVSVEIPLSSGRRSLSETPRAGSSQPGRLAKGKQNETEEVQTSRKQGKGKGKQKEVDEDEDEDEVVGPEDDLQAGDDAPGPDEFEEMPPPKKGPRTSKKGKDDTEASKAEKVRRLAAKRKREAAEDGHEDEMAIGVRRSSRRRVEPLAFWRGEKIQYARRESGLAPHYAIQEVVRVQEDPAKSLVKRKRGTTAAPTRKGSKAPSSQTEVRIFKEDPEEGWDALTEPIGLVWSTDAETEVERRIAFTANMMDPKPIGRDLFAFQKIFTEKDYMAGGVLKIPVGGQKGIKPSRDNSYMFFVFKGAVEVVVHKTKFRVAPGACFFIPRGNNYGIDNVCERDVWLYFVQARQVRAEPEEVDSQDEGEVADEREGAEDDE